MMPLDPCSPGKWFPTEFIDSTCRLAQSLWHLTGTVGWGAWHQPSWPAPHPLPREQRRRLLSWCDLGESRRLSLPPVALQPGGLPLPQLSCHLPAFPPNRAGGKGPPSRAGSASSRPPGMGELGDLGLASVSPPAPGPLVIGTCPGELSPLRWFPRDSQGAWASDHRA